MSSGKYVDIFGLKGYLARIFPSLSSKLILKELFAGRVVYCEPGNIINGSSLIVEFVRSMFPYTDNVLLLIAIGVVGLHIGLLLLGAASAGATVAMIVIIMMIVIDAERRV